MLKKSQKNHFKTVFYPFLAILLASCIHSGSFDKPAENYNTGRHNQENLIHNALQQKIATGQSWVVQEQDALGRIQAFYEAKIITAQGTDGDIPMLEVGPGWMDLANEDKHAIAVFIDRTYGISNNGGPGSFIIRHWNSGEQLGTYTAYGLNLY